VSRAGLKSSQPEELTGYSRWSQVPEDVFSSQKVLLYCIQVRRYCGGGYGGERDDGGRKGGARESGGSPAGATITAGWLAGKMYLIRASVSFEAAQRGGSRGGCLCGGG
jgi:hypothetical protein